MPLPVVAIVGRPNVGKSTLFNRLCGFKKSVVHDRPGVTRDRIYEEAELLQRDVMLIDTGGLEPDAETDLLKAMRRQTLLAIQQADVIIFVTDATTGYTPPDQEVAGILRKSHKPVLLAVNKVDGPKHDELLADFWDFGFEPISISAAHGRGVYELLEAIEAVLPPPDPTIAAEESDAILDEDEDDTDVPTLDDDTESVDDEDDEEEGDEEDLDDETDEELGEEELFGSGDDEIYQAGGDSGEADDEEDLDDGGLGGGAEGEEWGDEPEADEGDWEYTWEASDVVDGIDTDDGALEEGEDGEPVDRHAQIGPIRVAVVGRPNIGKSTLINRLIGEDRHLVLDQPGTTTDPVDSAVTVDGREYVLVDTAGVRRKSQVKDDLERFVTLRSIRAIERCHVTCLVIDAIEGLTDQDARLVQLVIQRGRALIILINKWDLTKDLEDVGSKQVGEELARRMPHATWARHLFISGKTGKGCHKIFSEVEEAYKAFNKRVSTSKLNKFLIDTTTHYTPPQRHHHPVRLYYMTQARVRPPTFTVFSNTPEGIGIPYQRYLQNQLRQVFDFWGTPIKIFFRKRRKTGEDKQENRKQTAKKR